jgi:hypothetical protein
MNWLKTYVVLASVVLFGAIWWVETDEPGPDSPSGNIQEENIPCLQMYYYLDKYSIEFGVPMDIAMGVAYQETRYQGPFHWTYVHNVSSPSGAVGPMQVMPSSATKFNDGKRVSPRELRNNIELNVKISMRMLSYLKRRYGTWGLALGAYNTGKPCYNSYASRIIGNDSPVRKPF